MEKYQRLQALKQRITTIVQSGSFDPGGLVEDIFELQELGWRAVLCSGGGLVEFEQIEVATRSEAASLGYVEE